MPEQFNKIFSSVFKKISKIASIAVLLVGIFVLIGWAFDTAILKSISPQFVAMKANTALAFVFASLPLWRAPLDISNISKTY